MGQSMMTEMFDENFEAQFSFTTQKQQRPATGNLSSSPEVHSFKVD